jgi:hypothetical protein
MFHTLNPKSIFNDLKQIILGDPNSLLDTIPNQPLSKSPPSLMGDFTQHMHEHDPPGLRDAHIDILLARLYFFQKGLPNRIEFPFPHGLF